MKKNGNDKRVGDYYLGLDIGTDSVGWATTDKDYKLLRLRGKDAWGVRLFDEGNTAEERRMNRTNRRRLKRSKWRLTLLKELFSEEIARVDAGFYQRMEESSRVAEDKKSPIKYSLFADAGFTDKDYFKRYPTVYHLRKELVYNKEPHDVRLVYLAIHHIIKSRGHFLYSLNVEDDMSFKNLFNEYLDLVGERFELELYVSNESDIEKVADILGDKRLGKKAKSEGLKNLVKFNTNHNVNEKTAKAVYDNLLKLCAGNNVELNKLFYDIKFEDKVSVCVSDSDDKLAQVFDILADDAQILSAAKAVYERATYEAITNSFATLSEYKIAQYDEHKKDIRNLKDYVKIVLNDKALAHEIFDMKKVEKAREDSYDDTSAEGRKSRKEIANYAAYSRYKKGDESGGVSQEEFCKFLKSKLGTVPDTAEERFRIMMKKIEDGTFAPKLRTTENGVISNSLHKKELDIILDNAASYLPFLKAKDDNGLSVTDKIKAIFDYKLPYYVGPLKNGWAVRKEGRGNVKILPWNFDDIIDHASSAEQFIKRMSAICTYTADEVLPFDSLLYSEFCVLNEINNIRVNGYAVDIATKQKIYKELFVKNCRKVTKKSILQFLKSEGLAKEGDIIGGIDEIVKSSLRSYHELKDIIEKIGFVETEEIIRHIVLLGNDKNMLAYWIRSNTPLDEVDIKRVCRLKYKDWGRFSKTFLTQILDIDRESGTGEMVSIIEMMRRTNNNLMQLLGDKYDFAKKAAEYKADKLGIIDNPRKIVDDLYVSPKIRRAIWQALRITDEIVDIRKGVPKKIFIEVARDNSNDSKKGTRTSSRKEQLLKLYQICERQGNEIYQYVDKDNFDVLKRNLENEPETMGKHLFLYYRQFGKCMYSGQPIELSELKNKNRFDIDHIFPRSKIKDDSLDNLALVKAELNREKTNIYPIDQAIRSKMYMFWKYLLDIEAISQKKFERLVRHTPLTEEELAEFVNRQLVETRQSTKALAEILRQIYGKSIIVYSKADNVSDFRKNFNMLKCREINDLHHAHDAYLNIVVGNYFDTRFTDTFRKNIVNENYSLKTDRLYSFSVRGAWQTGDGGTIETVKNMISKTSILYTRMPYEAKGKLFDVKPLGKRAGLIPLKNGQSTEIYGGYGSPKGAYWALVERIKYQKKAIKTVRSLEAVFIMQKEEYEKDCQAFAQKHWLDNDDGIKVIIPKIMKHSLLEVDGIRMHITGRTAGRIKYIHANQLFVVYEDVLKFRKVCKYVEKCKNARKSLTAYDIDGVDLDSCIYLYDLIIDKLRNSKYTLVPAVCKHMEAHRSDFMNCQDPYIRCKVILQCLNALRCNAVLTNLKEIGGPSNVGEIRSSKIISNSVREAYLINQSVTGLYEKKIDLLH